MVAASGVGFLVTSAFTASNTVPATYISSSSRAIGPNDLKPAGCNSITLTSILTGTNNFNVNTSNTLVLGDSTKNNIADKSAGAIHENCIIGGSNTDKITGKAGDFCEVGVGPGSTYATCTQF
jgi:hypothetical protein